LFIRCDMIDQSSLQERKGCLTFFLSLLADDKTSATNTLSNNNLPYRAKDYFFSKAERSFYLVLQQAVDLNHYEIFAKVRLADLLWLPKGTTKRQSFQNRIQSKHVDFIICDRKQYRPLLAIELDDSSHQQPTRKDRDAFVDAAFMQAGLPLLHIPAQKNYNTRGLATQIAQALHARP